MRTQPVISHSSPTMSPIAITRCSPKLKDNHQAKKYTPTTNTRFSPRLKPNRRTKKQTVAPRDIYASVPIGIGLAICSSCSKIVHTAQGCEDCELAKLLDHYVQTFIFVDDSCSYEELSLFTSPSREKLHECLTNGFDDIDDLAWYCCYLDSGYITI